MVAAEFGDADGDVEIGEATGDDRTRRAGAADDEVVLRFQVGVEPPLVLLRPSGKRGVFVGDGMN